MSAAQSSSSEFVAWTAAIRQQESCNGYSSKPDQKGHLGAYRMGPFALQDSGFQDAKGNWTALAHSMGVTSADSFLSNPEAQDRAYLNFTLKNYGYLKNDQSYIGQSIDNVTITESGLLAGVHLVGHFALEKFLTSKGKYVPKDGNHPPVLVTTYLKDFGGYDFVYDKKTNTFINSPNITPQHSEALPQLEGSSLHKAAVAIGSAHHISIAPRQKNGTGKQSSTHSASHANTSAAELTASQVRSIGVAALGAYSVVHMFH